MTELSRDFLNAAKDLLGTSGWSQEADQLQQAATPWRGTYQGETPFLARPASTGETAALIKLCHTHHVAVTPQGGNTGLVDGGTPHGEICLSMTRMQAVRQIDGVNNSLILEAGAPLVIAQEAAERAGRLFPLSLGSEGTATIGGLISTNAGGVAVLRYGMMRDLLLGLEVVLPNGEVWSELSGLRKNNTGYDLKHLFAGAEGTLGVITAACLKLFPKVQTATAWVACETAQHVVDLLAHIRCHVGDTVTSFEIIPTNALKMVEADYPDLKDPCPGQEPWRVLIEVSMTESAMASELLQASLVPALEKRLARDVLIAKNAQEAGHFWTLRETIPLSKRAYGTAINHDISVPISKIPAFLRDCHDRIQALIPDTEIVAFGHVGDGNLHYSACEAKHEEAPRLSPVADQITHIVHQTTLSYGGSISAEHGVGRLKRDELAELRPAAATWTMQAIKRALDPKNIMNPGRVVSI